MTKDNKFKAVMQVVRAILFDLKTVTTVDGEDINVDTDGEITEGCKVPGTGDGAYRLPDGRTLIVAGETITKIEEAGGDNGGENGGEDKPQNEGGDDDKQKDGENTDKPTEGEDDDDDDDDEKGKEFENLKAENERLKAELASITKERDALKAEADNYGAKKAQYEKLDSAITAAGGIEKVLNAVSGEAPSKTNEEQTADAYKRLCEIAKL